MVESGSGTMLYELKVGMTCDGCSSAIEKIFGKCEDITEVNCDVAAQKVLVKGKDGLDLEAMLKKWVRRSYLF